MLVARPSRKRSTNCRAKGRSSPLYPRRTFGVPQKFPTVTNYERAADKATLLFSVVGEAGIEPTTPGLRRPVLYPVELLARVSSFYGSAQEP